MEADAGPPTFSFSKFDEDIRGYLRLLSMQHQVVYIDCEKDTQKERRLSNEMRDAWRTFPWQLKKTLKQIQTAAEEGTAHPPEVAEYVRLLSETIAHSRMVILRRTEDMIFRRIDGVYPRDEDPTNSNLYIYSVHDNVVRYDLEFKDLEPEQLDLLSVKIPLPIQGSILNRVGNIPEVEFVWATCTGETADGCLHGTLYNEPMWATGFSGGDEVSFETSEIHDVHNLHAMPTGTLPINNAEGMECLTHFCENFDLEASARANLHLAWFRMSDREKLHIINFCNALRESTRRKQERRKAEAQEP